MRRLTLAVVVFAVAGYAISGCGARTGDELFGDGNTGGFAAATGGSPFGGGPTGGTNTGGAPFGGGGVGGYPYGGGGDGGYPYGGTGGYPYGGAGGYPYGGTGGYPYGGAGGYPYGGAGGYPYGGAGGYGGSPGNCCYAQQTPGCYPPEIAQCVCQNDSYCCQVAWDDLCASEVQQFNCGSCGGYGGAGGYGGYPYGGAGGYGGYPYGGGGYGGYPYGGAGGSGGGVICGGQKCASLQVPGAPIQLNACCPPGAPGSCGLDTTTLSQFAPVPPGCQEKNQPGKPDPTCPPAQVQGFYLVGCCKPSGICGNDLSAIQLGCIETWPYSGGAPGPVKCGGGSGGAGGFGGFGGVAGFGGGGFGGMAGGGGFTGSCCQPHGWPGCDDPKVFSCVCPKDPYCCQSQWDGICANEVNQLGCGNCGAGGGGAGGFGGFDGGGPTCFPQACPSPGPFQPCCVSPFGPCGVFTPAGCQPLTFDGGL